MKNWTAIVVTVICLLAAKEAAAQTPLPRAGWVATASSSSSADTPQKAIDGNAGTRFSSGADQTPGQWFSIDMITPQTFSQITIDPAGSTNDFTRAYQVFASDDAVTWGAPVASGSGSAGVLTIVLPTRTARFIGIVQTGTGPNWWSIGEINVFGPGAVPMVALNPTGWTATASTSGGSDVPSRALDGATSTRWTTGLPQTNGQFFQVDMKQTQNLAKVTMTSDGSTNDYPRGYQIFVSDSTSNWGAAVASGTGTSSLVTVPFAPKMGRYLKIVQTGSASNWWSIAELQVFGVGTFTPVAAVLPRTGWTATASSTCAGDVPSRVLDDNATTRWSSGLNQASGQSFQLDMQSPQAITKLTLDAGSSSGDYPRAFSVYATNDTASWGSPIATGNGSGPLVTVSFSLQTARFLKVVLTGSSSTNWWSIHELNVYGIAPTLLLRNGWVASASLNSANARLAVDGNLSSRWSTSAAQVNGQSFQVDMRAAQSFSQIILDADGASNDFPAGYQVFASNDGTNWGAAIATGVGSAARVSISFPLRTARYFKIVQTGSSSRFWSIAELNVYAPLSGQQQLHGHITPAIAAAPLVGPLDPSTPIHVSIDLPVSDLPGLRTRARQVADNQDPLYNQFLTMTQFAATFGAPQSDYDTVVAFATSKGLTVDRTYPNRLSVAVSGTAAAVGQAFYVTLNNYMRPDGTLFYAPDREPSVDTGVPILGIDHLNNFNVPRPASTIPGGSGSGENGNFMPRDLRNAYASCASTYDGTGESIGIFALDGFNQGDIDTYASMAGLVGVPTPTVIALDGASRAVDGTNHDRLHGSLETALDIEMAIAMAPKAQVVVFLGNSATTSPGAIIDAMAAHPEIHQISISYDILDYSPHMEQTFLTMGVNGQSVFIDSGDNGAYGGFDLGSAVDSPSVTVVGGTALAMNGAGTTWASEPGWLSSGGGVLTNTPIPDYQVGINMATNGGSTTSRNAPDVSAVGSVSLFMVGTCGPSSAFATCTQPGNAGQTTQSVPLTNGGTSASTPLWAGFTALINHRRQIGPTRKPVGFLNPTLYFIGKSRLYDVYFNDAVGNDRGRQSVAGYDLVTGWGSPKCELVGFFTPTL